MKEIKVPRNRNLVIAAIVIDFVMVGILIRSRDAFSTNRDMIIIAAIALVGLLVMNGIAQMHYTLNSKGLHQHFLLFTNHIPWDRLTEAFIQQDESGPKGRKVLCLNFGVRYLVSQRANVMYHLFRFHVIRLSSGDSQAQKHSSPMVDEAEMVSFLSDNGIFVQYKY